MSNLHSQVNDNTPVLVGCAQYLDKKGPDGLNYLDSFTQKVCNGITKQ